jgi:hypothetical protein
MRLPAALVIASILVAACSGASSGGSAAAATGTEVWRTATLHDVATGEDFRITDLEGKVVLIEAMAVWCINCRMQQLEARAALAEVDSSGVVYLSLDVDPNERAEDLAEYARREGFTWRFAVASPDVSRSLAATFGEQVLSPPATPLIVLGPDGQLIDKHFGIKRAGDLASLVREHLP